MFIRISDNVLDSQLWTVGRVEFSERTGRIVTQEMVHEGAYCLPNCIGWAVAELLNWQDCDPTGQHPETYNEVSVDGRKWRSFLSEPEIRAMMR